MITSQVCRICGESKPIESFSFRNDNKKYRTACKSCHSKQTNAGRYNVTIKYVQELKQAQGGCCAICGSHESDLSHEAFVHSPLVIDHDHDTGEVRGLLCPSCNVILGHAKDNPQILLNAVSYLVKHQS